MDYIFRRLALDYLPFEKRSAMGIYTAEERQRQLETGSYEAAVEELPEDDGNTAASLVDRARHEPCRDRVALVEPVETKSVEAAAVKEAPKGVHTSAELMEAITGTAVDSPLCFTCGTKMRPAGSCYVCEGCGSTSGCS